MDNGQHSHERGKLDTGVMKGLGVVEIVVAPQHSLVGVGNQALWQEAQVREADGKEVKETDVNHPAIQLKAQTAYGKVPMAGQEVQEGAQQRSTAHSVHPQSLLVVAR